MINNPALGDSLQSLDGASFLSSLLGAAIGVAFAIGVTVFLFMFLSGGIQWIASGNDKGAYEAAKQRITKAVVGLIVLLSTFAFINFIGCVFGVNFLEFRIGELDIGFTGSSLCGGGSAPPSCTPCGTNPCCQGACIDTGSGPQCII